MSDRHFTIEGNFTLPVGYRREFRLTVGSAKCLVVVSAPSLVEYSWTDSDQAFTAAENSMAENSMILDWIQESIETARADSIPKR